MRSRLVLIGLSIVVTTVGAVIVVSAGNPDTPPGPPETTSSYTLEDIYDRLDTGATSMPVTFTEPISGPTVSTMHTLNEIYTLIGGRTFVGQTGQTVCYQSIPAGGTCTCGETYCPSGQDGDLELGVDWPEPRFITGTTGVVTDTLTGLVWLENANCSVFFSGDTGGDMRSWGLALAAANALASGYCGLTDGSSAGDWRLPNLRELHSLVHYGVGGPAVPNTAGTGKWSEGDPFIDVELSTYWTSTTHEYYTGSAWYVSLTHGAVDYDSKDLTHYNHVWPVRGGQ